MKKVSVQKFSEILKEIEKLTGWVTFEPGEMSFTPQVADQIVFYGTSDTFNTFDQMIRDYIPTGTVAVKVDTKESLFWSDFKKQWY